MAGTKVRDAHVYLPADLYKRLQAAAEKAHRSVSAEICYRVEESLKNRDRA